MDSLRRSYGDVVAVNLINHKGGWAVLRERTTGPRAVHSAVLLLCRANVRVCVYNCTLCFVLCPAGTEGRLEEAFRAEATRYVTTPQVRIRRLGAGGVTCVCNHYLEG